MTANLHPDVVETTPLPAVTDPKPAGPTGGDPELDLPVDR